jgi:hypothetical protein
MARALRTLDPALVRRLAVSRQRLTAPLPPAAGPEGIMSVAADLGSLQLDPISVVARSHLLVLWSRLGRYDPAAVEDLLRRILVAGRKGQQRVWDLAERWLPAWAPTRRPPEREVVRLAAQRSLRALGVATTRDIDRHFTAYRYPGLATVLASLERSRRIERVRLAADGAERNGPWYVHADDLALLERLEAGDWRPRTTLLSPFDNLIINRERTERLFGFSFRLEIYVPKAARRHGYYVLPVLHGDRFVGRVDPALDRKTGRLTVHAVHAEPDAPSSAGPAVASALQELATFLGAGGFDLRQPPPAVWRPAFA